jgi:hypothetical protein
VQKSKIVDKVNHVGLAIELGIAMVENLGRLYGEELLGSHWLHGNLMY